LREGWGDYEPTERDAGRMMQVTKTTPGVLVDLDSNGDLNTEYTAEGVWVERAAIPLILSLSHRAMLDTYAKCRLFGSPVAWPYAGGWAEQPCQLVDLVESLLIEDNNRGSNS